ncbi:MAG: YfiR family protein [Flavobacteriales bacterium]|nr:YfiR family protein [Flavobacteriales bacterium]
MFTGKRCVVSSEPSVGAECSPRPSAAGRQLRVFMLALPLLLCSTGLQREPEKDTTAIVQASYIYNIAKLVEWKDPAMRSNNFIIGIIGGSNLYQELIKKYATKTIGKQQVEVRKLLDLSDEKCHILFVGKDNLTLLPSIYKRLASQSTLLITEYPDALEDGSIVNFTVVDNTLKFELGLAEAKKHRLEVGATLKQLAHNVLE